MSDDADSPRKKKAPAGAPAWMGTFADLMSLLMCFFVLLLSFSEMDVQKYKIVAGSMAQAFGMQKEVITSRSPMATSFVANNFTQGRPDPSPIEKIKSNSSSIISPPMDLRKPILRMVANTASRLRARLDKSISGSSVQVETSGDKIIIRIREKSAFPSGSDQLFGDFEMVLADVGEILAKIPGKIVVAGHTDNIPIATNRFRSNWELSTARAVTVVHGLINASPLKKERFRIEGYAETQPMAPNDTPENRALNRRVEIIVEQLPPDMDNHPQTLSQSSLTVSFQSS